MILETEKVCKRFGGLQAVKEVSLQVEKGQIFGLIGPNGAGKTTFLNSIAGTYAPESGKVIFTGKDVTGYRADKICHAGMARTYQIVRSFPQMTVRENVMVGGIFGGKQSREKAARRAEELLDFVEFPLSHDLLAQNLNTIQLKRMEMARALATNCHLLLLDEVAAGLTPGELNDITALIRRIRDMGITIIIVEHLMKLIMDVCDRISVLYFGEKLAEGTPEEITENEKVIKAYLGENYLL
ncbi:ABC transporter ATP-binding protein [Candidatus Formimonas warabiya]|uniref:ABC transporter ATP-binding protein n=1 Tax=Formimonas warabiya TaxID=1761012 RepID=A0A3G1KZN0_FORW1|nr:ABC transporter ATP-binding protein [Candidatus Formimonas warabiya]ATW27870.1 ABC transporter ATP-binding protein [Candidatus Formimonas warabiya]